MTEERQPNTELREKAREFWDKWLSTPDGEHAYRSESIRTLRFVFAAAFAASIQAEAQQQIEELDEILAIERIAMFSAIETMGGKIEGQPTGRHNFLQRLRQLVEAEKENARLNKIVLVQRAYLAANPNERAEAAEKQLAEARALKAERAAEEKK